jgi:hypothetical protein
MTIHAKGSGFDVDYWRKGRRKTPFHRGGLTQPEALSYVYDVIARTTFD